ncbi:hypothetical protein J6590_018801 [Homalodisca vitripennis]|nr:hypothetical protein J6590_018801 [Homalodisca vitripennis]
MSMRQRKIQTIQHMGLECTEHRAIRLPEKVTVLHAERRCLLTTIEVLEADLETLRLEVGSMSAREKQSQAAADIYTELSLAALNSDKPRTVATTAVASPTLLPTSTPAPATPQTQPGVTLVGI